VKGLAIAGAEHPAITAWATVRQEQGLGGVPVETLQNRRKGTVYRLIGAGPSRTDVVAKRSSPERIARESSAYAFLAGLPVAAVHCYGSVPDAEREDWWLFVAYAGTENYSLRLRQHRALAARWLAVLHTSCTAAPPAGRVSDRAPGHYLARLERGRSQILQLLPNPALERSEIELLKDIVRQSEILARRWREVERICARMPRTLVHGDFAPKNIRVADDGVPRLLAFDWASGGWGVPAVDLPQAAVASSSYWANPDLDVYLESVRPRWPHVTRHDLVANAAVGKVLRSVVCIELETLGLATDWPHRSMARMRDYHAHVRDAFGTLRWDR
jgi:hypothetical protein